MQFRCCLFLFALVAVGCARVIVTKDPSPGDNGIRFYRPKPYLFIGPAGQQKESADPQHSHDHAPKHALTAAKWNENSESNGSGEQESAERQEREQSRGTAAVIPITIRLEYLPDYSEEYSIRVTPGLGQAALNISLQNGWNLNSVDAKTDQRYAEIIGSVASLVGSAAKLDNPPDALAENNVPLGYYEGVLATNQSGRKELIGWRYVGFLPCFTTPVEAQVIRNGVVCSDEDLYALVFEQGTLMMKSVQQVKRELGCRSPGENCTP